MNPLVKKEIRLLLPSWMAAVLLALVQAIIRPYNFYAACLLFFGLAIMALTTFGRETSLNTFSLLLAQSAERMRVWQTKLSVLAVAFLTVFGVWLVAFRIAFLHSNVDVPDQASSYNLFITICLIATATFTGGLWTTLLLRQLAAAFWLTLLVPAVLSGFAGGFLAPSQSNNTVIAVLCVVFAIYSVGGFLFARWLFFRAQDVGWSGGVLTLPEWKLFTASSENAILTRNRKPIFALVKKEFQLHQVSLMAAFGLLVLHVGVIILRKYHHFAKDTAGEWFTTIFWMLWLVMAPVIGSMAVAEERRLGVMEGQLCLPVSRRVQFAIKGFLTLFLGIFLGGVMPMLLEGIAIGFGSNNSVFKPESHPGGYSGVQLFQLGIVAFAAWLALVSFFASTLAKNFLQAVGVAIATFFCCTLLIPVFFTSNRVILFDLISVHSILPLVITVATLIATLLWLAYLNYKNFRPGWPLWRRNLLGFAGAFVFIVVASNALYHRVWEIFEPAEPAHGPARLSISQPSVLRKNDWDTLTIILPDGQIWFDFLHNGWPSFSWTNWRRRINPLSERAGPQKIIAGSNWVSATAGSVNSVYTWQQTPPVWGHPDTIGIRSDGTLWVSDNWNPKVWTGDKLTRFGDETNWQQVARSWSGPSVLLLKKGGTLWRWGTNYFTGEKLPQRWLGLRAFIPYQIGTNSDWKIISTAGGYGFLAQKSDGTTWTIRVKKGGIDELIAATNFDRIPLQELSRANDYFGAYVRTNGTLWLWGELYGRGHTSTLQSGMETNWVSVAVTWSFRMVALKSDGTLWECCRNNPPFAVPAPPTRIGIHNDWIAIVGAGDGVVSLAADGSLWFWPDRNLYEWSEHLLKFPKQPRFLGNIFGKAD